MQIILYKRVILWFFIFILADVICYPTVNMELLQAAQRNEKQFPNGTVIGKYSCMDKEGNPVQVKYYADDGSYGVELKSIKVVDTTNYPSGASNLENYPPKDLEPNIPVDISAPIKQGKRLKSDPFELLHKEINKLEIPRADKSSPDFEIYYKNELNVPKECGKEKVRVYFDKERKSRNMFHDLNTDKYCE